MNSETTLVLGRKTGGWSILWGILLMICGILAIAMPLASSIGLVLLLVAAIFIHPHGLVGAVRVDAGDEEDARGVR